MSADDVVTLPGSTVRQLREASSAAIRFLAEVVPGADCREPLARAVRELNTFAAMSRSLHHEPRVIDGGISWEGSKYAGLTLYGPDGELVARVHALPAVADDDTRARIALAIGAALGLITLA